MLRNARPHLDGWSLVVILITFVLFLASLAVQGLGHDLFLEAGVFLVSVKLIMMAYKNGAAAVELDRRLETMQVALDRIENSLGRSGEAAVAAPRP